MLQYFLKEYLRERPLFLALIRAKEAQLYQKYIPLKKPVLDVGCGDGFFVKVTFGQGRTLSGSDPNQLDVGLDLKGSRIDEAKNLVVYKKLVTYDGRKIPFPNNYFSTVVSNCVLEHVEHLDLILKEIQRVIKPGGVFLTSVMAKPWEDNLFGAILFGTWYQDWMRKKQIHLNLFTKQQWDKLFTKLGFEIEDSFGYLSPQACRLIDLSHYLSAPNLISYKLFGKWVLFPEITQYIYPIKYFSSVLSQKVSADKSGTIFYVLRK